MHTARRGLRGRVAATITTSMLIAVASMRRVAATRVSARHHRRPGLARLSLFTATGLVGALIAPITAGPVHADIRSCGIGHPSVTTSLRDDTNFGYARLRVFSSGADRFEFRVTYFGGSQGEGTASGYSADGSSRTVSLRTGKGQVTTRTDVVLYKGYSTCRIAYLNDSVRVY